MLRYFVSRLVGTVLVMLGMMTVTFFLACVIPANPAAVIAGRYATAEQIAEIERKLGLDRPVWEQYVRYMGRIILRGDFGYSYYERRPVLKAMLLHLPASLELALVSFVIFAPVGVFLGVLSSLHAGRTVDLLIRVVAILGVSFPVFGLGLLFQVLFHRELHWLPLAGRLPAGLAPPRHVTGLYILDSLMTGNVAALRSSLSHIVLPALTLGCTNVMYLTRMTRSAMLDVLDQEWVRVARAKGLPERVVVYRHALRNALIPVVTVMGVQFAQLIGWAFLVEVVFAWPGIGTQAVKAIMALDVPMVIGTTLVGGLIFVLVNFCVDILYGFLDPRIRSWDQGGTQRG